MITPSTADGNVSPWNADEIDELCGLVTLSIPWREIARRVGRTQEEVRTKAKLLGRS